ncbi:MAG TPA: farnesyl diphosphate synthase [Gammaproteobacteria bacterium]|nr:farnesyl diphosphate synthase [Gammaproteobacteria bacterium]
MAPFKDRIPTYLSRVEDALDARLPAADAAPEGLHAAMRYSVLGGGKRIRPLLCYATGETLGIGPAALDDPACAVELIHAFSLVHDDLPAMDDDELRRGRPTTHKAFDTATAILAGDALQTLAFNVLARGDGPGRLEMLRILSDATGSHGMTGGQAMDLAAEGREIPLAELETLHRRKTGCLIHSAVAMACCACPSLDADRRAHLDRFAANIGLAFQIRDDVLDVEGDTAVIGKTQGADAAHDKSTYPALMGLDAARRHADEIYESALAELEAFGAAAEPLRWMGEFIVRRDR